MKLLITTQVMDKNHPILGFFHGWVQEFAQHFERIDVICLEEGEHSLPSHVYVHSLEKEKGRSKIKYLFNFYRHFYRGLKQKPDFVFFHMGAILNILAAPFFLLWPKRPKFYWWKTHGQLNWLGKVAAWFVDRIYTAGDRSFPSSTHRLKVVGHGIDTGSFPYRSNSELEPVDEIRLLSVGRVTEIKNTLLSIEVVRKLTDEGLNVSLSIVGPLDNKNYVEKVKQKITEYDLSEKVVLMGPVPPQELLPHYHQADILLHPAQGAGYDKVVLEAGLCGVVPITTTPSYKSLLEGYDLYVEVETADNICRVIKFVSKQDKTKRANMMSKLRGKIVEKHSLATLHERIFS